MKISFYPPPLYKCIVVFILALFLSFTFFSCGGLADNVPDGYGNVRVSFGSSRNVTQDDKDAASVTVYFNGNKIEKKGDVFEGLVESGIKLTITAEAVSGGRIIGKGEETITVKSGTNDVSMKIYTYDNFVVTIDGKATGWTNFTDAWNAASGKTAVIKMNADTSSVAVTLSGGNVTLDLNGHTITGNGSDSVILIDGATLTLEDSKTGGKITGGGGTQGGGGGGLYIEVGATFIMNGGTITGTRGVLASGGGVYNDGTFIMNAGTISGNISEDEGGGVTNYGDFTMNGGVIRDNKANNKGGGVHNAGTFTMNGGTISGNTATSNGGGVYVGVGQPFNQNGGSIIGNSPDNVYRAN